MKRMGTLAVFVCALALGGVAGAGSFDDADNGNWNSDATWGLTDASFPGSGDTALIDSNTVTANVAIDPGIALVDIATGGTLYINPVQIQTAPLQLNGGKIQINRDDGYLNGTLTVKSDSTLQVHSVWNYEGSRINGAISDFDASTTGLLSKTEAGTLGLYVNNMGFSGGWDIQTGQIRAEVDGSLGSGTVTVRSGAGLYCSPDMTVGPVVLWMEDNTRLDIGGNYGAGDMYVDGGTVTINCWRNNTLKYFTGDISGTGKLNLTCSSAGGNALGLGGDNSGFLGDIDINTQSGSRSLVITDVLALGTNAGGTVTVKSGAILSLGGLSSDETLDRDLTLEDGATLTTRSSGTVSVDGTITLQPGQGTFYLPRGNSHNGYLNVNGQVTGDGRLMYLSGSGWQYNSSQRCTVTGTGNNYAGGTAIDSSFDWRENGREYYVRVTGNGGLSTGTVQVDSGALYTDPDDPADAVLTSVTGPIDITSSMLQIDSTETKRVNIREAGVLRILGGSTVIDYTPGSGVFQVYNNAVLDSTVVDTGSLPALSDIQGAKAQNQVLKGYRANIDDEQWVGPGAGGNGGGTGEQIWGGLAGSDYNVAITGTVHEYTAGEGFTLGIQKTRQLTLSSTGALDATGPINLVGNGFFEVQGTPIVDQAGEINMNGGWRVLVKNAGGIPASKTLNVNDGYLDVDDPAAIAGTVNANSGGGFYVDQDISSGTVNVNSGGGLSYGSDTRLSSGAAFTWQEGAHLALYGNNLTIPADAEGKVNYLITGYSRDDFASLKLGDNTRLTVAYDLINTWEGYHYNRVYVRSGVVTTVGSQGRIAAEDNYEIWVDSQVDFPGAKLIIGDASDFTTFSAGATADGSITQGGVVRLSSIDNDIGEIDIQAGGLFIPGSSPGYDEPRRLGGATAIRVGDSASLQLNSAWAATWTLNTVISGNGTVKLDYYNSGGGPSALRLAPTVSAAAGLSPGDSVGSFTVDGHLAFGKVDIVEDDPDVIQEWRYGQLIIDVDSEGGVAGTDHDHVSVTGGANCTDGELAVDLPLPSGILGPDRLPDMTIVTCGGDASGAFASVVIGGDADDHWAIDAENAVTVDADNDVVILHGSAITWNGFGGDADLNGLVNYLDLGVLATYYDQTGLGWGDGDFNFDGKVDYMDLGILATNYDLTEGSGGAPVPEPAFAILLGAGALGLLRRRRQR